MAAKLVLEDGSCFEGVSIGAEGTCTAEVILNTGVVGYQENLTDPANAGKILVPTYPLIGNTGVAEKFSLSARASCGAVVIKELSSVPSNFQSEGTLDGFLAERGMIGIAGVDTRAVAVTIRDKGEQVGIVSTDDCGADELLTRLREQKDSIRRDRISELSVSEPTKVSAGSGPSVAVVDLGVRADLTAQLTALDLDITLLPFNTPAETILEGGYEAVVFTSGPEEDEAVAAVAQQAAKLLGKLPLLGAGVGHEVLALACGAKLTCLPVGHRGANYPAREPDNFNGEITVQNHRYVVERDSLGDDPTVTLINVNDETVEEIASRRLRLLSTQTVPAAAPGEIHHVFTRFAGMVRNQEDPTCRSAPTSTKS
ncbi:MAG: carbamoyl phosphate synthase small subunit [Phycisphaerae bacterium]